MKKNKKRILSLVLVIVMLFSFTVLTVSAETADQEGITPYSHPCDCGAALVKHVERTYMESYNQRCTHKEGNYLDFYDRYMIDTIWSCTRCSFSETTESYSRVYLGCYPM